MQTKQRDERRLQSKRANPGVKEEGELVQVPAVGAGARPLPVIRILALAKFGSMQTKQRDERLLQSKRANPGVKEEGELVRVPAVGAGARPLPVIRILALAKFG
jgi:hypothetical protein